MPIGCVLNNTQSKIYGVWKVSASISEEEFRSLADEPLPEGFEMEMTIEGEQIFHRGGQYDETGEITLWIRTVEGEVPLRVSVVDQGAWSLRANGGELVKVSAESSFAPLDDLTAAVLDESAETAAIFQQAEGEEEVLHILSLSETEIEVDVDGVRATLRRK